VHIPEVSKVIHNAVASYVKKYDPSTVLDIGGFRRLQQFLTAKVTDANINNGIDGTNLPYKDNSFDVTTSIATLEHVNNQAKFMSESIRTARIASVHWFPFGPDGQRIEDLLKGYNHKHDCVVPSLSIFLDLFNRYDFSVHMYPKYKDHLKNMAHIKPQIMNSDTMRFIERFSSRSYGIILEIIK